MMYALNLTALLYFPEKRRDFDPRLEHAIAQKIDMVSQAAHGWAS